MEAWHSGPAVLDTSTEEMTSERAAALLHELLQDQEEEKAPLSRISGLLAQKLLSEADGTLAHADAQALAGNAMREWQRAAARAISAPLRVLQFYSMSRDADDLHLGLPAWRKTLSNFCEIAEGLVADGARFRSVEHYFQGAKFTLAGRSERARAFELGGAVGSAPLSAKKAGARKAFEAAGCKLDLISWDAISDGVMWHALLCRACADAEFCTILLEVQAQGAGLLHFERQGARSYWGGSVNKASGEPQGRNRLGELMSRLASQLAHEGGANAVRARCAPEQPRTPEQRLANWAALATALAGEEAGEEAGEVAGGSVPDPELGQAASGTLDEPALKKARSEESKGSRSLS